jgi:hypothetical protein
METCKTKKREGKEQHIFLAFCFSGFDYKATHARTHTHTHTHTNVPLFCLSSKSRDALIKNQCVVHLFRSVTAAATAFFNTHTHTLYYFLY